jgi:hypothetical protein
MSFDRQTAIAWQALYIMTTISLCLTGNRCRLPLGLLEVTALPRPKGQTPCLFSHRHLPYLKYHCYHPLFLHQNMQSFVLEMRGMSSYHLFLDLQKVPINCTAPVWFKTQPCILNTVFLCAFHFLNDMKTNVLPQRLAPRCGIQVIVYNVCYSGLHWNRWGYFSKRKPGPLTEQV